jgi:molybdopterin biosynthesis enzyme
MKPGKPLVLGRLGDAAFLGLPGNPQAALAGAVGFLSPLLAILRENLRFSGPCRTRRSRRCARLSDATPSTLILR